MEGSKFSSSRQVVIYVRDFLARYDADALRYYIAVAGPETQDTDFTWAEFVRRNNDELVATWGNLVNRAVSMAAKNIGSIPAAGELTDADRALLDAPAARSPPSADLSRGPGSRPRSTRRCGVVGEANKYLSDRRRGSCKTSDPERMATVLHVALQVVRRRQDAADPVPAALVAAGARDARRHRRLVGHAARSTRSDEDGGAVLPGDHRRLRRDAPLGVAADRGGHAAGRARRRCSPSWTRRWSTRSSPGSRQMT